MQKWEYFRLIPYLEKEHWKVTYKGKEYAIEHIGAIMDELGENGWELVAAVSFVSSEKPRFADWSLTYSTSYVLYFKRPKAGS